MATPHRVEPHAQQFLTVNGKRTAYVELGDGAPVFAWPREISIDGEPLAVVEPVTGYADWMAQNGIPKLFVNAEPGAILVGPQREFCRRWRNQPEVTVRGSHFFQEDSGREIGEAIASWAEQHVEAAMAR